MTSLTDLAVYLSTGRCIAWIGAGPSIELGLPSWDDLAKTIVTECQRIPKRDIAAIQKLYDQQKYPELFDRVENTYGRQFLLDICSKSLHDKGIEGSIYRELTKMGFLSYFTTNFDQVLRRHLKQSDTAVLTYSNSDDDLCAIDVDTTPALVELHGTLSDPDSLVLTKADYQRWYQSGHKEAFQTFIRSHLSRDRILFVGYSLTDPDLMAIQERLAVNLRRAVSSIALLPNASEDDVDYWGTYYNVDVLSYRAVGSDHSGLRSILATTSKVMGLNETAPTRRSEDDLRKLQALYLWHRFNRTRAGEAPVDALQSVILKLALDAGGQIDSATLVDRLKSEMGVTGEDVVIDVDSALQRLEEAEWIETTEGHHHLLDRSLATLGGYERRFNDMMSVFGQQALIDMRQDGPIAESTGAILVDTAIDTLIDIFEIRGREIVQMAFGDAPLSESGLLELIETIWRRANTLDDARLRFTLVGFILDILSKPSGIYENVLNYLAQAFFCIQALRIDSNTNKLVTEVVSDRALLIDANVLISLTAEYEERHRFVRQVIQSVQESGIALYTTMAFIDEVRRHANWALQLVNEFGEQSVEVLNASKGQGGYNANAYLRGFIGWKTRQDSSTSFLNYIRECFGGSFRRDDFNRFFFDRYGIRIVSQSLVTDLRSEHVTEYDQYTNRLDEWNADRRADNQKSSARIQSEVDAFIVVTYWSEIISRMPEQKQKCSYLSLGSSLPRLARAVQIRRKMVSVSPQAIWELLDRLKSDDPVETPDFRSLMLTSYFRLSGHFLDSSRYKSYFRPLIEESRRGYLENREVLEGILEIDLQANLLDDIPEEEWPVLVRSLTETANRKSSIDKVRIDDLSRQNEELKSLLDGYRQKEMKRKEYIRRQRAAKRARRS